MKSKIITMAGSLGSGKTSTSNGVAKELDYKRFSAGDFLRATANSLGLTYDEFQKIAAEDPSYDLKADNAQKEAANNDESVIDSRLGYYFIPNSYKVFLYLDPQIAAQRIMKDAETNPARHQETSEGIQDIESIIKGITERLESERLRYRKHYGIEDHYDPKNFDLYINTAEHPLTEVIRIVTESYKNWLES